MKVHPIIYWMFPIAVCSPFIYIVDYLSLIEKKGYRYSGVTQITYNKEDWLYSIINEGNGWVREYGHKMYCRKDSRSCIGMHLHVFSDRAPEVRWVRFEIFKKPDQFGTVQSGKSILLILFELNQNIRKRIWQYTQL